MNYVNTYSDLYDPAFPASTLDIRTELLLGGVWTDVSKKFYQRAGLQITRGHPDESSNAQPSVANLQLNNRRGQFSPRNPLGAYYGLLGKNTPCRLSVPAATPYLRLEQDSTSYASCPDRSALDFTGDIDVRIDMRLSNYGQMILAAKWNSATDRAWAFRLTSNGTPVFEFVDSTAISRTETCSTVIPLGRIALRATVQMNNGSGGHTTTFYTAPTIAGPWTQLGTLFIVTGTLAGATSTAPICVGYSPGYIVTDPAHSGTIGSNGSFYGLQVYNGVGGTLVASPDFTAQNPGTSAFADAQGNIWSMNGTAEISGRHYKHHGEVPAWPQRWDSTAQDVYVPITPSGLLRRLTQGTPPQLSAMFRAYGTLTGPAAPIAYWPCEDGVGSASIASGLTGGSPLQVDGPVSYASNSDFVCSQAIPVLNQSSWSGPVGPSPSWTANILRFLMEVPSSGDTVNAVVARMYTSGSIPRLELVYLTGGALEVNGYGPAGTLAFTSGPIGFAVNGQLLRASLELYQTGSTLTWAIEAIQVSAPGPLGLSGTLSGQTLGAVVSVQINPGAGLIQTAIGHVSVQAELTVLSDAMQPALNANVGETAGTRFVRLCAEQGVPARLLGFPADTVPMGYQEPNDFVSLLQECEDADRGLIFEPRQVLALGYRTRSSMLNQSAAVTISYTAAQLSNPVEPTDDDQYTVNDVTVTRTSGDITGSSARQYDATSALSILPPPDGVGEYPDTYTLNLATDPQSAQVAGWILHVGTVDEPHYPSLTVDLTRSENAAILYSAQDADIGDRITVANTPTWLPPDGISQILRGISETLNAFALTETWVGAPESAYRVGVYDDAVFGHYDTDGSETAFPITATAVTMQVATENPGSPLWTTSGGDLPFDIEVSALGTAGERMTVTAITGTSSPQAFTVTRSVNGVARAWPIGSDVRLFQPAVYAL